MRRISSDNVDEALKNWASLNAALPNLSETQCWDLLDKEKSGAKRIQFLLRLYGRANKLRGRRERKYLFK